MAAHAQPIVHVFNNNSELFDMASSTVLDLLCPAEGQTARSIALAGGSTPKAMYERWANSPEILARLAEGHGTDYFFGDVRMVPDDHSDSNFKMAHEALLHAVPKDRVHNVDTSLPAAEAASRYQQLLVQKLSVCESEPNKGSPIFDVILLGCGPDGHTASLFPGTPASKCYDKFVTDCMPGEDVSPHVERVTLTPKTIINAKNVVVMATGANKQWVMNGIMGHKAGEGEKTPVAAFLRQCRGNILLLVDKEAAPDTQA